MTDISSSSGMSRRRFLTGSAGVIGGSFLGARLLAGPPAHAAPLANAPAIVHPKKTLHLAGTDGWVAMPASAPADPPFFPDSLAP
ncbi:MAG: hypothetical protein QOH52_78, partial [Pseudonocardiales bacterium]|nr:hypothetical protein [Pseudonocardiales bacterium]